MPQDYAAAVTWYRKLPNQALPSPVQPRRHVRYGRGVPQDYAVAMSWYRKAAEQGYANAQSTSASCTPKARACRRTMQRR